MPDTKKTIVLGASPNPARFSHKAVTLLLNHNHPVIPIGNKEGFISNSKIFTSWPSDQDVHTIAMYLKPENQAEYYENILRLKPQRIVFNPGTENNNLKSIAIEKGIDVIENCVLVMLSINSY